MDDSEYIEHPCSICECMILMVDDPPDGSPLICNSCAQEEVVRLREELASFREREPLVQALLTAAGDMPAMRHAKTLVSGQPALDADVPVSVGCATTLWNAWDDLRGFAEKAGRDA